jgi:hypothetical protein
MARKRKGPGNRSSGAEAKCSVNSNDATTKQTAEGQGAFLADLTPDLAETKRFLEALAPGTDKFTFQTFDDNSDRKNRKLARVLHGTLAEHAAELVRLNAAGAGIFVTINETDLQGREATNIKSVRAVFTDLDGAPLHPLLNAQPQTHIIVESSSLRYHGYWRPFGVELNEFRDLQKMLAAHFNGDKGVHDLPRVMRLPGFIHHKVKGGVISPPFRSRIVAVNEGGLVTAEKLRAMCKVTVVKGLEELMELDAGKYNLSIDITDDLPPLTIAETKAALAVIDPDIAEPDWFKIACTLSKMHGAVLSFEFWRDWSTSKGVKHKLNKPGQLQEIFNYITSKGYNYGAGTLCHYADLADPNWRDNVPETDGGGGQTTDNKSQNADQQQQTNDSGPQTADIISRPILRIATSLWGAGTRNEEQKQWQFGDGSKVVELRRGGNDQWFDFTARKSGNTHALMRLAEASAPAPSVMLQATPFVLCDPRTIPPRDWIYGKHYARGFLSATIGSTGGGKTSLVLVEAIAMASGRNLLEPTVTKKHRVWYWNGEEPPDELRRRVAAICLHYNIPQADLEGYLFLNSGRDPNSKVTIAEESERGRSFKIAIPLVEAIKREITTKQIDVMTLDPFIRTHAISENDNPRINAVADVWSTIAHDTQCAIDISHHTRKGSAKERGEYTAEDSRGASALNSAARSTRVLNQMTEDEAPRAQVKMAKRRWYFRVYDDKPNMAPPPESSQWYQFVSVSFRQCHRHPCRRQHRRRHTIHLAAADGGQCRNCPRHSNRNCTRQCARGLASHGMGWTHRR